MKNIFSLFTIAIIYFLTLTQPVFAQHPILYGMTSDGGVLGAFYSKGTIFEFNTANNAITDQLDFDVLNGANPSGSLVLANDGNFYGMTPSGGTINNYGEVFRFNPRTDVLDTLRAYTLSYPDGSDPAGSLVQASNGKLYGTTSGRNGSTVVLFEYDITTNTYTIKFHFADSTGSNPGDGMVAVGDKLYGMTIEGGANGYGVIYQYDPATGAYTKELDMTYATGKNPAGRLTLASNGKLYGTAPSGNASSGQGVLFEYALPPTNTIKSLHQFIDSTGSFPAGSVTQAFNGKLYGMTQDGGINHLGVLFEYDLTDSTYTVKHKFDVGGNGLASTGSVMQASDSLIYGMRVEGGPAGKGNIFSYNYKTDTYTDLKDLTDTTGSKPLGDLVEYSGGGVGITAVKNPGNINIYPNPATSQLIVDGIELQPGAVAEVMDMTGRILISSRVVSTGRMVFDVSNLTEGIYLVQLKQSTGNYTGKFVKGN